MDSGKVTGGQIWPVDDDQNHENMFIDINEPSIFFNDFPPLSDFPCMSSSSSTPSTPAAAKPIGASSSSSSWAVIKPDVKEDRGKGKDLLHAEHQFNIEAPAKTGDGGICDINCMDDYARENFAYMDVMEANEIWDPSSIFQMDDNQKNMEIQNNNDSDELGEVFFEWLKLNKEHITAEDMRTIKLRKATVEAASKKLGSSKEGKKQLLKLILDWVQQLQLEKRRMREEAEMAAAAAQLTIQTNPNVVTTWIPPQQPYPISPVMVGYMTPEPFNHHPQTWAPPPPAISTGSFSAAMGEYRRNKNQYPYPAHYYRGLNGEKLVRLGSAATKEARMKRMARQRRFRSQHPRRNHQPTSQNLNLNVVQQGSMILGPDGNPQTNWAYWPASGSGITAMAAASDSGIPVMAGDEQPIQQQTVGTVRPQQQQRRQGFKSEKNLKYLLQKVLKQSDVSSLGRIVLPKKESEIHLPELDARDGIPIEMEDIGTSRVWNMRYRFWPNNKSRMYLLENTGDFVRANGLQEGDFIVIYSDLKSGKYLIRGVKVRQTEAEMMEVKKLARAHKNHRYALGNTSTSSLKP